MKKSGERICLNDRTVNEHSTNDIPTIEVLDNICLLEIFQYLPICDRVRLERGNRTFLTHIKIIFFYLRNNFFSVVP